MTKRFDPRIALVSATVRAVILWIEWLEPSPDSAPVDHPRRARVKFKAPASDDPTGEMKAFDLVGSIRPSDARLGNLVEIATSNQGFDADGVRVVANAVSVAIVATIASVHYRAIGASNDFRALGVGGVDGFHSVAGSIAKPLEDKEGARCRFRGVPTFYQPKRRQALPVQSMRLYEVEIIEREQSDPYQLAATREGVVLPADLLADLVAALGSDWPIAIVRDPDALERPPLNRRRAKTKAKLITIATELAALDAAHKDMLAASMTRGAIKVALARLKRPPFNQRLAKAFDARLLLASGHVTMLQANDANASGLFFAPNDRVSDATAAIWHELALGVGRERSGGEHDWREDIKAQGPTALPVDVLTYALWRRWKINADAVRDVGDHIPEVEIIRPDTHRGSSSRSYALRRAAKVERALLASITRRAESEVLAVQLAECPRSKGINFDDTQRRAVETALTRRISAIAGPPGSGKTTMCRAVVDRLDKVMGVAISARAARVLSDKSGVEAMTLRLFFMRAIEALKQGRASEEWRALAGYDALIVDECSMLSSSDMHDIATLADQFDFKRLILVGDPEQLQPIEEGWPFADLIAANAIPTTMLLTNYRVRAEAAGRDPVGGGGIAALTFDIRDETFTRARLATGAYTGVVGVHEIDADRTIDAILVRYRELIEAGARPKDIVILSPFKRSSLALSTPRLNEAVRGQGLDLLETRGWADRASGVIEA
jgi:hypothetical protein